MSSVTATGEARGAPRPTPLVRRLLAEAGLAAAEVAGTGPGGKITRDDVAAAVAARGGRAEPLSPLPTVITERTASSMRTAAQPTSVLEVDVTRVAELRHRAREAPGLAGVTLSFLPFLARAVIEALPANPDLNATVDAEKGTVTRVDAVHLAVAVDTDAGLLAPVVRDAGRLSIVGLARAIVEVTGRARAGTFSPDELAGGTFTVCDAGSRGALFDTPMVNQPQVAILAAGVVSRRPVVVDDPPTGAEGIAIRSMAYLALTHDPRFIDGAAAATFLVAVKQRLEDARFESELGLAER